MKQLLIATLMSLASTLASAAIDLPPGGTIIIDGNLVTCAASNAPEITPDACLIKQYSTYTYYLYVGKTHSGTFNTFEEATEAAIKMKNAGLCR